MRANPAKPPMVSCPHCGSKNEDDGRKNCRNCHKSMSALEELFTTRDLATRYKCEPRAIAEKAWRGEWPSRKVLGKYMFTAEMVEWIDKQQERWPQNETAPAPQQPKAQPVRQPRQRRTEQPPPLPVAGNNVRKLVAKERTNRIGRSA